MATQVQAALIAAVVGLVTAGIGAVFSASQSRRERSKWLVELKSGYALELYKERLRNYPAVFAALAMLSHTRTEPDIQSDAGEVAAELNAWMYSAGGMCADAAARGAILGLRHACTEWSKSGRRPSDFYQWRNFAIQMLRRDLDLYTNETFDFGNLASSLQTLKEAAANLTAEDGEWGGLWRRVGSTRRRPRVLGSGRASKGPIR